MRYYANGINRNRKGNTGMKQGRREYVTYLYVYIYIYNKSNIYNKCNERKF
ncbi:hypothetical protein WN48_05455 [Eufriesea mexicana]|nr:hypothetical protein WN48_05455 [Eufriesea mexicana]